MKVNQHLELLKSLIISPSITDKELKELSKSIDNLYQLELKKIFNKIRILPLLAEKSETYTSFSQIMLLLLREHNMNLQKYENHCHSCIIPEAELVEMAGRIHEIWLKEVMQKWRDEENPELTQFEDLDYKKQKLYFELIYIIPPIFNNAGYEIIRKSESQFINVNIAEKLARVIHSSYKRSMLTRAEDSQNIYEDLYLVITSTSQNIPEFDDLPDHFKLSNLDSAYHIPTKLLSIGYKIQKVDQSDQETPLLSLTDHEVETLARMEHDRWSWERRMNGWTYSEIRNNDKKQHNCLIPYDELSEEEKEKDRKSSRLIPALLKDIGFEAVHISPELSEDITYIKKDWGYISKITTELNLLKAQLQDDPPPALTERVSNIEILLKNIKDSFSAGKKVQQSFLSTILKFKEYLPSSFVLFKPKDIVSGDFYYVEKIKDTVIFAAADCTGHGIPAAILTSSCYNFLDMAVRIMKITDPSEIHNYVIPRLENMYMDDETSSNMFGMDITICAFNTVNQKLIFSGFGNPLFYFRKGEFHQIKGVNSLAGYEQLKDMFIKYEIQLFEGDTLYIFSDGFKDQYGGDSQERYNVRRFKSLLQEIQELSISEQCETLNQTIENWRRSSDYHYEQTDDILIIGVKI